MLRRIGYVTSFASGSSVISASNCRSPRNADTSCLSELSCGLVGKYVDIVDIYEFAGGRLDVRTRVGYVKKNANAGRRFES